MLGWKSRINTGFWSKCDLETRGNPDVKAGLQRDYCEAKGLGSSKRGVHFMYSEPASQKTYTLKCVYSLYMYTHVYICICIHLCMCVAWVILFLFCSFVWVGSWGHTYREKEREDRLIHSPKCVQHLGLCQTTAKSQELNPGFPYRRQDPEHLDHLYYPWPSRVHVIRKLESKANLGRKCRDSKPGTAV